MTVMTINVNGVARTVDVDPATPLLWVLRDVLGLTGTKYGCGIEICNACNVWIDGSAEKACHLLMKDVLTVKIVTVEGLATNGVLSKIQQAFIDEQTPQCGFCQSGVLMRAAKLVNGNAKPTDGQIDAAMANICACGTYPRIRAAIKRATGQAPVV